MSIQEYMVLLDASTAPFCGVSVTSALPFRSDTSGCRWATSWLASTAPTASAPPSPRRVPASVVAVRECVQAHASSDMGEWDRKRVKAPEQVC